MRLTQRGIELGRYGAKPMVRALFAPSSFPNNGSNQNCIVPGYSDTGLGLNSHMQSLPGPLRTVAREATLGGPGDYGPKPPGAAGQKP